MYDCYVTEVSASFIKWGCREIDSPDRGRRDSYESRLLLKFILEKEKKMANDNHLSLRSML